MAAQTPKGNMPVVVLKDDASQVKGREAQKNNIAAAKIIAEIVHTSFCLLYTSPSPRDLSTSRMPSSA